MKLFKLTAMGIAAYVIIYIAMIVMMAVGIGILAVKGGKYIEQYGLKSVIEHVWEGKK